MPGGETKQVRSKIYFDIFIETMFAVLLQLLKMSNRKATVSKEIMGFDA